MMTYMCKGNKYDMIQICRLVDERSSKCLCFFFFSWKTLRRFSEWPDRMVAMKLKINTCVSNYDKVWLCLPQERELDGLLSQTCGKTPLSGVPPQVMQWNQTWEALYLQKIPKAPHFLKILDNAWSYQHQLSRPFVFMQIVLLFDKE